MLVHDQAEAVLISGLTRRLGVLERFWHGKQQWAGGDDRGCRSGGFDHRLGVGAARHCQPGD